VSNDVKQFEIMREQQMVLNLTSRPSRNLHKTFEIGVSFATASFGKVSAYRCRRSLQLGRQSKPLMGWEISCNPVDF